jgi:hypothetical protein
MTDVYRTSAVSVACHLCGTEVTAPSKIYFIPELGRGRLQEPTSEAGVSYCMTCFLVGGMMAIGRVIAMGAK